MNSSNSNVNRPSKQWDSRIVLFLRWILGALAGFGVSLLIFHEFMNETFLAVPFIGQLLLFDPSFRAGNLVTSALIWGFIGALLASGRKEQISVGAFLLLIYVIVGCYSFFRVLMMIPT